MTVEVGGDPGTEIVLADLPQWGVQVITITAVSGFQQLFGRPCQVVGWSTRETTGTAVAGFDLYDGPSTAAQLLATVQLAAGQSSMQWFGRPGPRSVVELNVNVRAGALAGVVYVRDLGQ